MDILKLHSTTYIPLKLIENYRTAIWTERYLDPGDFQIVTTDVAYMMAELPLDTLISHRETYEVMIVETHEIVTDKDGIDVLTVSGRSFETVLENRVASQNDRPPAAFDWGYYLIDDNTGMIARGIMDDHIYGWLNPGVPPMSVSDKIPNYRVYPAGGVAAEDEGEPEDFNVELGDVHTEATKLLRSVGLGLRNVRPAPNSGITELWSQVYRGLNRTKGQSTNAKVILREQDGHFESAKYLFSHRGYKNGAYVFSNYRNGSGELVEIGVSRVGDPAGSGRGRRILYVDAKDVTKVPPGHNITDMLRKRGRAALGKKENKKTSLFECKVKPDIPYKYNVHYALGDSVTVQAKYGIDKTMVVAEYIRSESREGDVGYPTLVEPNSF